MSYKLNCVQVMKEESTLHWHVGENWSFLHKCISDKTFATESRRMLGMNLH